MERGGVVAMLFLILTAGVLGYVLGILVQAGDLNDSMDEDAFFKDCNIKTTEGCNQMHVSLAIIFIVFSVVCIFIVYRNASSVLTPILWYYFVLMAGFGIRFLI